jgi:hypothetical protein
MKEDAMNANGALRQCVLRGGVLLVAAVALGMPGRAIAANPREGCFNAYERAQRLRQDHKLRASREQLRLCADTACPAFVKGDCSRWLGEVDAGLPAVLLTTPSDQKGRTENRVAVFVDGELVAEQIDGRAIPVDPGPHDVRYELDGRFIETHVVVPEGQKEFPLVVDFRQLEPPPAPARASELASWPEEGNANRAQPPQSPAWYARLPLSTYALGGVAVAGLGAFAGFGVAGNSAESCAPSCTRSQVAQVRTDFTIADVSLGVSIAAAAGALYFALSATPPAGNDGAAKVSPAAWWLGVRPAVGGATVATGVSF